MKQCATVTAITDYLTTVELDRPSACSECDSGKGCGAGLFARLFLRGAKPVQITIAAVAQAEVGDRVSVNLPDRWLLRVALGGFFVPVLLLVAILVAGHWAALALGFEADAGAAIAGLGALALFAVSRTGARLERWLQGSGVASGTVIARAEPALTKAAQTLEHYQ